MKEIQKQAILEWFRSLDVKSKIALWNKERNESHNTDEVYFLNNTCEWEAMYGNMDLFDFAQLCGGNTINSAHDYFVDTIYGPKTVESHDANAYIDEHCAYILNGFCTIGGFQEFCKSAEVDCSEIVPKLLDMMD